MTTPIEAVPNQLPAQPVQMQPTYTTQTVPQGEQYFTAEQVERFRAQERDKLHLDIQKYKSQLDELQGQVGTFAQEREAAQQAEAERQQAEAEAARKAAEEEMSARQLLEQQRVEWETRFTQLEQDRAFERATLEKEKEFATLQAFAQRRVREEQQAQTIAPELLDLIDGSTEEAIEQSITRLKEKTNAIVANMQGAAGVVPAPRGVSPAGYAAMGPLETNSELRPPTPEEIKGMNMEQYRQFRDRFGIGSGSGTNGQGIFN